MSTFTKKKKKRPVAGHKRALSKRAKRRDALPEAVGAWFEKLVNVQARLRASNGCPWDREQTHQTLRTYLIEEAYEVLDALETGDDAKFAEELGDLLLQIVFHCQIASEGSRFNVSDVIREIHDKMVRRHPHVFGEKRAKNAAEVLRNWERLKAEERKQKVAGTPEESKRDSLLDGISRGLPATLEGLQLTRRAARIGFDWENARGVLEKVREEATELERLLTDRGQGSGHGSGPGTSRATSAPATQDVASREEEVGDLLFAAVNLARFLHIDPEIALKRANQKFSRRFREMEHRATNAGQALASVPRARMEALWDEVKRDEGIASEAFAAQATSRTTLGR